MSRNYKNKSIVSGLSISDILSFDNNKFNALGLSDLKKVVGRLVSAGNKRLRRFAQSGVSTPATRYVEKSGGMFSTRGKNLNELRAEYARAKSFLEAKTGTRKGWEQTKSKVMSGLKKRGVNADSKTFERMWKAYEKLKERSPEVANRGLKYGVLREISETIPDTQKSAEEIALEMERKLKSIYEQQQTEFNNHVGGISEFFEIE